MRLQTNQSRRGVAIIIVLTMVSIALAISYAMLRTQTTTVQVQSNSDRRSQARGSAMAGLAAGLRRLHLNSWSGVGTTFTGNVDANDSYSVSYTAGDDSLTQASSNYADWHIRVTVVATGTSVGPASGQVTSSHQAKAVVQLSPRALGSQPNNWSQVQNYSLYQTSNGQFTMQVPGRIEGSVRLQGTVQLADGLNWSTSACTRYFSDLNAMRTAHNEVQTVTVSNATGGQFRLVFSGATTSNLNYNATDGNVQTALRALATIGGSNVNVSGANGGPWTVTFVNSLGDQGVAQMSAQNVSLTGLSPSVSVSLTTQGSPGYADCRPLTGPVSLPTASSDGTNLELLSSLDVTTNNIAVSSAMSLSLPNSLSTYCIYTGGPAYNVPQVSSNLINTTLAPNAATNPLGIYFCAASMTVCNNVTVAGTLIGGSSVTMCGHNVVFQPIQLWPLAGTSAPVRLPAIVARQNFRTDTTLSATINGCLLVGQQFLFDEGQQASSFALVGRLITNEFILRKRSEWSQSSIIWDTLHTLFNTQLSSSDHVPHYPIYLAQWGFDPNPTLTIRPDPSELTDHWQNLANPIYVAHPSDPGLRWDVIRMETGGE